MAIDKGTLESLKNQKQKYGTGSKQAWESLKAVHTYDILRDEVIYELKKSNSSYEPTTEEIINLCAIIRSVSFDCPRIPHFNDPDSPRVLYKRAVTTYFLALQESQERIDTVLQKQYLALDSLIASLDQPPDRHHADSARRALQILADANTPKTKANTGIDKFIYGAGVNNLGISKESRTAFDRGVREQTLHHLDIERRIALNAITRSTEETDSFEACLKTAIYSLTILMRSLMVKEFGPGLDPLQQEELTLYLTGDLDTADLNFIHVKKKFKTSLQLIQPLMNGTASEQDIDDYIIRQCQYTIRAIENNEGWLRNMLR